MKKGMIALIIIMALVIILAVFLIGSYNGLVSAEEEVNNKLSQIDSQLQRRSNLIPNLVETVKKYTSHEKEVFESVSESRAKLAGASTITEREEANEMLTSSLNRLIAIAEAYPELKANENFIALQDELAGTENRIATARKDYNDQATKYNTKVRRFPTNILAGMFGFDEVEYFSASEGAKENPNVGDLFGN